MPYLFLVYKVAAVEDGHAGIILERAVYKVIVFACTANARVRMEPFDYGIAVTCGRHAYYGAA